MLSLNNNRERYIFVKTVKTLKTDRTRKTLKTLVLRRVLSAAWGFELGKHDSF